MNIRMRPFKSNYRYELMNQGLQSMSRDGHLRLNAAYHFYNLFKNFNNQSARSLSIDDYVNFLACIYYYLASDKKDTRKYDEDRNLPTFEEMLSHLERIHTNAPRIVQTDQDYGLNLALCYVKLSSCSDEKFQDQMYAKAVAAMNAVASESDEFNRFAFELYYCIAMDANTCGHVDKVLINFKLAVEYLNKIKSTKKSDQDLMSSIDSTTQKFLERKAKMKNQSDRFFQTFQLLQEDKGIRANKNDSIPTAGLRS